MTVPIETILKMKKANPNLKLFGQTLKTYEDFLEKEAENNLLESLKNDEKKVKKVKQVRPKVVTQEMEPTTYEGKYEVDNASSEKKLQQEEENN